jgi:hypothetical protein
MELTLNLAWALLAVLLVRLWRRPALLSSASMRSQVVALLMLIVILFPVISVTDDLVAAQNPAELYCCARRHHAVSCSHSIFPVAAMLPPQAIAELSFGFIRFVAPCNCPAPLVKNPALASIQNRPPPVA